MAASLITLVMDRGVPLRERVFLLWPIHARDETEAVVTVLSSGKTNYCTKEYARRFEQGMAAYADMSYAAAVMNGSVALELVLRALNIRSGDEVVITERSFIASVSAVVLYEVRTRVAGVDTGNQNLTAQTIGAAISSDIRAAIAVHLSGWPCDMAGIRDDLTDHVAWFVAYRGLCAGPCARFSEPIVGGSDGAATLSFCQDKIMSTDGKGGMLLLRDEQVFHRVWSYTDHGKICPLMHLAAAWAGIFRLVHESFGGNWRRSKMQAAMGYAQLLQLPAWVAAEQRNARHIEAGLAEIFGLRLRLAPPHISHARCRYHVFVEQETLWAGWDWDRILTAINDEGVPCFTGVCGEIWKARAFVDRVLCPTRNLPVTRRLSLSSLCFQVHSCLDEEAVQGTVTAVRKVITMHTVTNGMYQVLRTLGSTCPVAPMSWLRSWIAVSTSRCRLQAPQTALYVLLWSVA